MGGVKSGRLWLFLQKGGMTGTILAIAFAFASMFFLGMFGKELLVRLTGAETTGTITERIVSESSCSSNKRRSARTCFTYSIRYAYEVDGRYLSGNQQVEEAFFSASREGQATPVRHLIFAPEWSLLAQSHHSFKVIPFALLFSLPAFFLVAAGRRRLKRVNEMINLRDHGDLRTAQVTAVERTSVEVNGVAFHVMRWTDEKGVAGASLWQSAIKLPSVGSSIAVFADPEGNIPSVWDRDCGGL